MNSRTKGKVGEREWAQVLRDNGWAARRGQQFAGGQDSPDVIAPELPIHWEVKRTERLDIRGACSQAEGDSNGKPWVVAWRENNGRWKAIMTAEFLFDLLRESNLAQPKQQQQTNQQATQ